MNEKSVVRKLAAQRARTAAEYLGEAAVRYARHWSDAGSRGMEYAGLTTAAKRYVDAVERQRRVARETR